MKRESASAVTATNGNSHLATRFISKPPSRLRAVFFYLGHERLEDVELGLGADVADQLDLDGLAVKIAGKGAS